MRSVGIIVVLFFSSVSQAALIVDTGSNATGTPWNFVFNQYFAGEFSITESYTLNSIEGFFSNDSGSLGDVTVSIHSDGGSIPGDVLNTGSVSMNAADPLGWYGLSGLNWELASGTYWASFTPDDNVSGAFPGGAPNPLDEYAQGDFGAWDDTGADSRDYLGIGIRIDATAAVGGNPVPAPATLVLVGLGLAGLGYSRRKKA